MKLRIVIIIFALLLPLLVAAVLVQMSKPTQGPVVTTAPNSNDDDDNSRFTTSGRQSPPPIFLPKTDGTSTFDIPETKELALELAEKRLAEISKMTQAEWNVERLSIPHRNPPFSIEGAIARAQLRVNDLKAMNEEQWQTERVKMYERELNRRLKQEEEAEKKKAESDRFRDDIIQAFKRAGEGK